MTYINYSLIVFIQSFYLFKSAEIRYKATIYREPYSQKIKSYIDFVLRYSFFNVWYITTIFLFSLSYVFLIVEPISEGFS